MHERILAEGFGLAADSVEEVQGGWAAAAFRVQAGGARYFLKAYDKRRPSIAQWTARIDDYIPALVWLAENTGLKGRVPRPLRASDGGYKAEDGRGFYLLFPYIAGATVGERSLTKAQTVELAEMIAALHRYGGELPFPTAGMAEDISLSFCTRLVDLLDGNEDADGALREFLTPHEEMLRAAAEITLRLRDEVRAGCGRLALCHTDAHNWNLMQAERLMLIDWEGLRLAPVEADLFMFEEYEYFDAFMDAYRAVHQDFHMDGRMLLFYLFHRRMEDIWDFFAQLLYDRPDRKTVNSVYQHLLREFAGTEKLLGRWEETQ